MLDPGAAISTEVAPKLEKEERAPVLVMDATDITASNPATLVVE
jgi:hypothetical protein